MLLFTVLAVICLSLLASKPCHARAKRETAEIGLSLGRILVDNSLGDEDKFSGRLDIGVNLTDQYSIELSLLNSVGSFSEAPDVTFYTLSSLVHFSESSRYSPFFLAGVGAGNFSFDDDRSSEFIANAGGGIKYYLTDEIVLRLELRDYIAVNGFKHNFSATIGILYGFDISAPKVAAGPDALGESEQAPRTTESQKIPFKSQPRDDESWEDEEDDALDSIAPEIRDERELDFPSSPDRQMQNLSPPEVFPGYGEEPLPDEPLPDENIGEEGFSPPLPIDPGAEDEGLPDIELSSPVEAENLEDAREAEILDSEAPAN